MIRVLFSGLRIAEQPFHGPICIQSPSTCIPTGASAVGGGAGGRIGIVPSPGTPLNALPCRGFTFITVLFMVALSGLSLAVMSHLWHLEERRERELQLLGVGEEIRKAIVTYAQASPGSLQEFPPSLEALLEDRRLGNIRRHLRRIYRDPLTGEADWELLRNGDGGIVALRSAARGRPLKRAGFRPDHAVFARATSYRDWIFSAVAAPLQDAPVPVPSGLTSRRALPATTPTSLGGPSPEVTPSPLSHGRKEPTERQGLHCADLQRNDLRICTSIALLHGSDAAGRCRQSAAHRQAACRDSDGAPLIPLWVSPR